MLLTPGKKIGIAKVKDDKSNTGLEYRKQDCQCETQLINCLLVISLLNV